MTTSGTQIFNLDADGYCTQALKRLGVVTFGNEPRIEDMVTAKTELNAMIKNWRADGVQLWKTKWATVPLTQSDFIMGSDGYLYECIRSHTSSADTQPVTGTQYLGYWKSTGLTSLSIYSQSGSVTADAFTSYFPCSNFELSFTINPTAFPAPGIGALLFAFNIPYVDSTYLGITLNSAGSLQATITTPTSSATVTLGAVSLSVSTGVSISADSVNGVTITLNGGAPSTIAFTWDTFTTTGGCVIGSHGAYATFTGTITDVVSTSAPQWVTATSYNSICNPQLDSSIIGTDKRIIGIGNAFLRNTQSQDSYINAHLQAFEYFRMGNKINPGKPTMLYFKRNATVDEFFLYPYPDTTDYLVNVEMYYYPDDFNDPTDTADFLMEWEAAIIDGLTVRLYPLFPGRSRVALGELTSIFQDSYQRAKAGDSEKGDSQVVPDFWLNNGRY